MVKKTKSITPTDSKEKRVYQHVEDYFNLNTWRLQPISVEGLERKAKELCQWVEKDPKAFKFAEWLKSEGIDPVRFKKWCERCPQLAEAHKYAIMCLGIKRERGATILKEKIYDKDMIRPVMFRYDKDWKQAEIFRAKLRAKANEDTKQKGNVTVVIEKYDDKKE